MSTSVSSLNLALHLDTWCWPLTTTDLRRPFDGQVRVIENYYCEGRDAVFCELRVASAPSQ